MSPSLIEKRENGKILKNGKKKILRNYQYWKYDVKILRTELKELQRINRKWKRIINLLNELNSYQTYDHFS